MSTATQRAATVLVTALLGIGIAGCGTPGTPLPPSLNLPDPVTDLAANRTGNQVALTWTMPRRNTDKVLLKGDVTVQICRRQGAGPCDREAEVKLPPGSPGSYLDLLPSSLATGDPRPLTYVIELVNPRGRSAGPSNDAIAPAGQAPAPVAGLSAEVRKKGIVLHWTAGDSHDLIRLYRTLLNPPAPASRPDPLAAPEEATKQDLVVDKDGGVALDRNIRFGQTYEYRAQRFVRLTTNGKTLELAGAVSDPVRVEANDVFPPAVPVALAAVASGAAEGTPAFIDLSWQADAEDVAGYRVYRRDQQGSWRRISGDQPVVGPAFHDTDVQPGQTYTYAVSAVDARGNESARSAEATETVPQP